MNDFCSHGVFVVVVAGDGWRMRRENDDGHGTCGVVDVIHVLD